MSDPFAETSPPLSSGHADDALSHAVVAMRPGWIALRGCVLDTGDAAPAPVRYALLHPQVGIALLDVVPGRTTPHAPDHLKRALDAAAFGAEFGYIPPILYFCIPVRALPDVGYLLEHEFGRQPPSPPLSGDAWVTAAQAILSAQLLPPPRQLASRMDDQPLQHAPPEWQRPARRFGGGARLLAGFWGLATLTAGGGALFLQCLGPPEKAAQAAAPLPITKADASGPVGADLRRTLIENDQAIQELQNRLKGPSSDAGPGMVANAVLTSATLPGAAAGRSMGTTARMQRLADVSEENDTAPAQEAETGQASASPAQDATPYPADVAGAEAALRQIRADAEAAQKRLMDTNAQVERAGQQVKAAEQQLATLHHQSEDAQATGTAVGKQLTDAQSQLSELEERRSAAEQQLAAAKAQLAQVAEQQERTLAPQADHGKLDAPPPKLANTAPAGAAAAPHDSAAVEAAPSAAALSLPNRLPDPASAALTEAMVRRGDALLQRGDISAARLLYDRAASAGSAHAATAMGKTYDATVLAGIGVVGLSSDPALAALWYRRGLSLGDEEAHTRLQSLPPASGHAAARAERP